METKTVLITGATSGIGKAIAYRLAASKMQLIICGRRTEELEKIREDLSKLTAVTSLCFDVSKGYSRRRKRNYFTRTKP